MTALSLLHRAATASRLWPRRSSASIAVRAIALADRPCASFRNASLPTDVREPRDAAAHDAAAETLLGDDLGDERAEPAGQ